MLVKYAYLLLLFVKNSLLQAMVYRTDFLVSFVTDSCSCLVKVLFVEFIFRRVASAGNGSFERFMICFGCAFLMEGIYMFFFFNGHTKISRMILTGEMDYFLSKPVSEIFYLSFHHSNIGSGVSNLVLGSIYLFYGVRNLQYGIPLKRIGIFVLMLFCGLVLYFSISFILNCLSFWILQAGVLFDLFLNVTDLMRYPGDIFPKNVRFFITFMIPLQFIAIVPAKYLMGEIGMEYIVWSCFLTVIGIVLVKLFYHYARKAYQGGRG